jgi:hypothetical protein
VQAAGLSAVVVRTLTDLSAPDHDPDRRLTSQWGRTSRDPRAPGRLTGERGLFIMVYVRPPLRLPANALREDCRGEPADAHSRRPRREGEQRGGGYGLGHRLGSLAHSSAKKPGDCSIASRALRRPPC